MSPSKSPFEIDEAEARRVHEAYGVDTNSARLVLSLMDRLCMVEADDTFFTILGTHVRSWLDNPQYKLPLSNRQIKILANEGF